ncbi:MAG: PilZ domain-containing protein [Terracidiphilus sp.]
MEAENQADCQAADSLERRAHPRHEVDEDATLLLLSQGSRIPCRMTEVSVEGCRLRTSAPFLAGTQMRVEVAFNIRGIAFRFSGVTEWTQNKNVVGILFLNIPVRRKDELAEMLCEVETLKAAKLEAKSAEPNPAQPPAASPIPALDIHKKQSQQPAQPDAVGPQLVPKPHSVSAPLPKPELTPRQQPLPRPQSLPEPQPLAPTPLGASTKPASSSQRERRTQSRHPVDTSAVIFLINIGAQVHGRIQDLSVGGCRIRTHERFPVGIYTRVETEFRLEGLPFRLGGVIQAVHDQRRQLVGIRFLDMSVRKREQVEQLIQEIEENRAAGRIAKPADAGETPQDA